MTNVVRCDGCGGSRSPDIDHHGWPHVEVAESFDRGGYDLDACCWACLRDVAESLGDLTPMARYRSLGCNLAMAVADVLRDHGPLDPALGAALAAWEKQLAEDKDQS